MEGRFYNSISHSNTNNNIYSSRRNGMRINVKQLLHSLKNIGEPDRPGQILRVLVTDRLYFSMVAEERTKAEGNIIILTAKTLAVDGATWYEWEIEI